jgi:hypothetical protein
MQRKYWVKRGIINENQDFFGYKIDWHNTTVA